MTRFEEPARPGRPYQIDDATLLRNRRDLIFVLEENWALIGWPLHTAKSIRDVGAAFALIQGFHCPALEPFTCEQMERTTPEGLRATIKRLEELRPKLRPANLRERKAREDFETARLAAMEDGDAARKELMARLYVEHEETLAQATREYRDLNEEFGILDVSLRNQTAYLAKKELLRFLGSGRYALDPLTLASVMAGLPHVSWRHSLNRCRKTGEEAVPGHASKMFCMVSKVCSKRAKSSDLAVARMKAELLREENKELPECVELREHWYFLEGAIRQVYEVGWSVRAEIPYRIFGEYMRRWKRQEPGEVLLKEQGKL